MLHYTHVRRYTTLFQWALYLEKERLSRLYEAHQKITSGSYLTTDL